MKHHDEHYVFILEYLSRKWEMIVFDISYCDQKRLQRLYEYLCVIIFNKTISPLQR